ncbi:diacylglycerol O-acyltransferase 1 [Lithohypha guttulata]|uniref:diacylglycerol O-acyltransferase n=1 Tax=Lithohypha guttulata TaxID=1690604 RepID=A0ABR0KNF3_9EURO|nr:diacylglycerol O-acyltransferase 1 [Lithohypha guttulata]
MSTAHQQVSLNPEPANPEDRAHEHLPVKSYADAAHEAVDGGPSRSVHGHDARQINGNAKHSDSGPSSRKSSNDTSIGKHVDEDKVEFEKYSDGNGSELVSVKPDPSYEENLKHNGETAPRSREPSGSDSDRPKQPEPSRQQDTTKSQLRAGREAGAGWERSAIRWAPMNVPLQRRIQMIAVLWHTTSIALLLSLFFLFASIPLTWPLLIPYLIYTLVFSEDSTDGRLRRRSELLRRSKIWSAFASYFPARLHRTVPLVPTRKYIFGYHPHGIISHGAFAAFGTEALGFTDLFPGITNTLLTLDTNFRVPFYRDYALALGLQSVSRESIENLLSKGGHNNEGMGRAVTVVVGGARESLDARPHHLKLVLNSRKGFIKIAIRQGADLVPVLAFGENELYEQVDSVSHPYVHKMQMVVKKMMGFTVPLFHARGIFNYDVGLLPYRRAVNVVVGKPIAVKQQGGPGSDGKVDEAYLDEVHAAYVKELTGLWDRHKDTFAKERKGELEILE